MKVSKSASTTARRIYRLCSENGQLNEERLRQAVQKIGQHKPRDYRGILQVLRRLVQNEEQSRQVTVESATELNAIQAHGLKTYLEAKYGRTLDLKFFTNPELLGGLRVCVGNDLYENSVKASLNRLVQSL